MTTTILAGWIWSRDFSEIEVGIENPAGRLDATVDVRLDGSELEFRSAAYRRSTQILLRGHVPLYRPSAELREALLRRTGA